MTSASDAGSADELGGGGTHTFLVPDRPHAEALADALAELGFLLVTAN